MPEIAEVFTLASGLASLLDVALMTGVRATGVNHPLLKWDRPLLTQVEGVGERPRLLGDVARIEGYRPRQITHQGKVLRMIFAGTSNVLDFHFGMIGRLGLVGSKHDRVRLHFGANILHFIDPRKFGWVELRDNSEPLVGGKCAANVNVADFWTICFRRKTAIRDVLTNQSLIAGIGNYMVNEVLWKAQVHPFRPAETLTAPEMYRIGRALEETITDAARAGGATLVDYFGLNGDPGMYAKSFNVYGKKTCPRCYGPIVLLRKKPSDQSSYVCSKCTPLST